MGNALCFMGPVVAGKCSIISTKCLYVKEKALRKSWDSICRTCDACDQVIAGTPVLALTGTADKETEKTVTTDLVMLNLTKLFVRPNRTNMRLSEHKVPKTEMLKHLDWLVDLIKEHGKDSTKTIIFCDTMYSIASVMNYLMMSLRENAFHPNTSKKFQHCLLGIFHSLSLKEYNDFF
ncbi:hypothetical protein OS493_001881 [Desmophyllum pertusum]|uniref:Uncharacterized protein n=1 Tax=Desmophyllum pertusum TaxID=174260 RepID=A0A9W9Z766_9CNID|nr:hypothetical protein OS493_001881 [Desmophyllum pertusum]